MTKTMTKSTLATIAAMAVLWLAVSAHANEFRVHWNIPTFQCRKYNLFDGNLTKLYGIRQNDGDTFRGDVISILYDPGLFPALLANGSAAALFRRNGGVPQAGNLQVHLGYFAQVLNQLMPDPDNAGLAIIDFESWRPVYRQNFGTLEPYKTTSVQMERALHPLWTKQRLEQQAKLDFEASGRQFMRETLLLAKRLRPKARWGYYGLPFCFNGKGVSIELCASNIRVENDSTQWLYDASQVIYPSVYMSEKIAPINRGPMVGGRVEEARRLSRSGQKVIVYHRYVYTDSKRFLSESDTVAAFEAMRTKDADGAILWGASRDLNSREKCAAFYDYLANVLGPIVRRYSSDACHSKQDEPMVTDDITQTNDEMDAAQELDREDDRVTDALEYSVYNYAPNN